MGFNCFKHTMAVTVNDNIVLFYTLIRQRISGDTTHKIQHISNLIKIYFWFYLSLDYIKN